PRKTTRPVPVSLLALALALGAGCAGALDSSCPGASPDWIGRTLVTVDVTGTWRSTEGIAVRLILEQKGTKVTGRIFMQPSASSGGDEIEGSVSGDVFRFNSLRGAQFVAEMRVSGDDMTGCGRGAAFIHRGELRLQRVS